MRLISNLSSKVAGVLEERKKDILVQCAKKFTDFGWPFDDMQNFKVFDKKW